MRLVALPPARRVWFFDLDNTLHDAHARIFPAMHDQINAYLMRHYGTDPRRFLAETHVFPELADIVVHENALKHALERLGGMKLVFSNAPRQYVAGVLRAIGLARYFDGVYAIEDARYRGKPALHGFHVLLRKHNLDPHRCAFVDDILDNLRTAHRLGMSTVWVSRSKRRAPFVDLRIASVIELPRLVFRSG
ncbi:MAG: HAD-IA family hydrolase [Burkholderiales bacterium]